MPFVASQRPCIKCGKAPGRLFGVEGQGVSPCLCMICFNGGKDVVDQLSKSLRIGQSRGLPKPRV